MSVLTQIVCAIILCYNCMTSGIMYTWPSSTILTFSSQNTTLNRPMGETEIALFGSLSSIGALVATPLISPMLDKFGRKYCVIVTSMMNLVAWILIALFSRVEVIMLAIFISGIGGSSFLSVSVYISEVCQDSIRGMLTSGTMLFYGVGMLVSYLLGGLLSYDQMIYASLSVTALGVVFMALLKESPIYLMQKGLEKDAAQAIAFFRGVKVDSKVVLEEIENIKRALNPDMEELEGLSPEEMKLKPQEEPKPKEKLSAWQFLKKSRSTRQAMFVNLVLMAAAILQGLAVVQVYAEPLFQEALPDASPTLCSVMLAVVGIVAGIVAAYLTDRAGRRPLMIYASLISGVCCVVLGLLIQFNWGPHWIRAVVIYLYAAAYAFGAATVPFVLLAEAFLPEIKSFATMIVVEWTWVCNFVLLFIFNPLVSLIGLGPVFHLFGLVCFLSAIFCIFYQPETKGLTVNEIQLQFLKRK